MQCTQQEMTNALPQNMERPFKTTAIVPLFPLAYNAVCVYTAQQSSFSRNTLDVVGLFLRMESRSLIFRQALLSAAADKKKAWDAGRVAPISPTPHDLIKTVLSDSNLNQYSCVVDLVWLLNCSTSIVTL